MRIRFRFLSSKKEQRGALRAGLEHGDGALCRFVDSLPLGPSSSFPVLNSCSPPFFDRWVLQASTRVVAQSGGDTVVVYSIAVDPLHLGARQGAVGSGSPHSPPRPARPSTYGSQDTALSGNARRWQCCRAKRRVELTNTATFQF